VPALLNALRAVVALFSVEFFWIATTRERTKINLRS
jgi:hypothetical protein